ncbi:MAG: FHA domain-containing protein [Myxococcales bacterium]|nr:FHA domain-containing protein [Myxococcales bacterium]
MDQSKKTMRHFYCRDVLWETFEQMAADFDCSVDYLVNESMRYYARSKNYQSGSSVSLPQQGGRVASPRSAALTNPPAIARRTGAQPVPRTDTEGTAEAAPSMAQAAAASGVGEVGTLFLSYDGQRYPITKDQFIIGRGSKTSDLAIKDGNISRKHAAIIRRNGAFYIKDLGSTNGIDYKGMRIDNKRIDDGDIFHICDYELRFSYQDE